MALKPHGITVYIAVFVRTCAEIYNVPRHVIGMRTVRPRHNNLITDFEILLGKPKLDNLPNLLIVGYVNRSLCNCDPLDRRCNPLARFIRKNRFCNGAHVLTPPYM